MEQSFFYWMRAHLYSEAAERFLLFVTSFGDYGLICFLTIAILLCFRKTRRTGICCALALFFAFLIGNCFIKPLVARPRPCTLLPAEWAVLPPPEPYSFPSAHAASVFSCAAVLAVRHRRAAIPCLCFAALMAVSRVYLLMHYPSDVLAGALLGLLCAYAALWIEKRMGLHQRGEQT